MISIKKKSCEICSWSIICNRILCHQCVTNFDIRIVLKVDNCWHLWKKTDNEIMYDNECIDFKILILLY